MAEILSRDDICNYFDLVGDHDDHHLYLFVKTAEHLCSLQYYCRLPTGRLELNLILFIVQLTHFMSLKGCISGFF